MPFKVINTQLLEEFYANKILLKYNSPAPTSSGYGWLKVGQEIATSTSIRIEQNTGLFGGPYKPMVGGRRGSGLASIGAFSYSYSALPDRITVGRYCSISTGLKIIDSSHPISTITSSAFVFRAKNDLFSGYQPTKVTEFADKYRPGTFTYPIIGNDVWIGDNVTLSHKISIGDGAVIAANSNVVRDVPAYAIVGGNPAKVIKYRFSDSIIERLTKSKWWDYDPSVIFSEGPEDIHAILEKFENNEFDPYAYSFVDI